MMRIKTMVHTMLARTHTHTHTYTWCHRHSNKTSHNTCVSVYIGVYPLIIPRVHHNTRDGRTKEWNKDWSSLARTLVGDALPPPTLGQAVNDAHSVSYCDSYSVERNEMHWFSLTIRVLTYTRLASLQRLIRSLHTAIYDAGDTIDLVISVDMPADDVDDDSVLQLHRDIVTYASSLSSWSYGAYTPVIQATHQGLVGQWINSWQPRDDHSVMLVLEDDMEVSRYFYQFLKKSVCAYYIHPTERDTNLYGISLQRQHYVVGQSMHNIMHMTATRMYHDDVQATYDVDDNENDIGSMYDVNTVLTASTSRTHPLYRYQLLGTWGALFFAPHWRAFQTWYSAKQQSATPYQPCVPFLLSSQWWLQKQTSVWSQWFIRFVYERGLYSLYAHFESKLTLAVNHREAGANFNVYQGPRDTLIDEEHSDLITNMEMTPINTLPLYDFHFSRVLVSSSVLCERQLMLTKKYFVKPCLPFKPNLNGLDITPLLPPKQKHTEQTTNTE